MVGVVKQINRFGGLVIECSCVCECMKQNPELSMTIDGMYIKKCILTGYPDRGNRCLAYPQESTTWFIDDDPSRIKHIPTNDGIKRII